MSLSVRAVLGTALLAMAPSAPGTPAEPQPDEGVWAGLKAADLAGENWTAAALLNRVVLLDFWATWCAPCLAEIPNLRRLEEGLAAEDLVILGVCLDSSHRREVRSFLLRHDMRWPQIHDGRGLEGALARRFGVAAVPRTVVVDRRGRVVAVDLRGEVLATVVRNLVRLPAEEGAPLPAAPELQQDVGGRRRF